MSVWDLTEEEKGKVNGDFVKQGLEMCSLKKELYCLEDMTSIGFGRCQACKDLESKGMMGNDLKGWDNRETCEYAKKIVGLPWDLQAGFLTFLTGFNRVMFYITVFKWIFVLTGFLPYPEEGKAIDLGIVLLNGFSFLFF